MADRNRFLPDMYLCLRYRNAQYRGFRQQIYQKRVIRQIEMPILQPYHRKYKLQSPQEKLDSCPLLAQFHHFLNPKKKITLEFSENRMQSHLRKQQHTMENYLYLLYATIHQNSHYTEPVLLQ